MKQVKEFNNIQDDLSMLDIGHGDGTAFCANYDHNDITGNCNLTVGLLGYELGEDAVDKIIGKLGAYKKNIKEKNTRKL